MTDEQIAKDFSENPNSGRCSRDLEIGCAYGLEKGRELEREKAMRFAEWTHSEFCVYKWIGDDTLVKDSLIQRNVSSTDQLYTSKAFQDYLNGLKK